MGNYVRCISKAIRVVQYDKVPNFPILVHVVNTHTINYNWRPYNNNFNRTNPTTISSPKEYILDLSSKEVTISSNPKTQSIENISYAPKKYNTTEELGNIKSNATLLDLSKTPK